MLSTATIPAPSRDSSQGSVAETGTESSGAKRLRDEGGELPGPDRANLTTVMSFDPWLATTATPVAVLIATDDGDVPTGMAEAI